MIQKIRQSKKLKILVIIIAVIVWSVIVFFPIRYLNSLIVEELAKNTIIDIKMLNNRSEDGVLQVEDFIKKDYIDEYSELIKTKIDINIPSSIATDIFEKDLKPVYTFNKGSLILTYDLNEIYGYGNPEKIEIEYNEISEYIKFKFEESNLILPAKELSSDKVTFALTFDDGPNGDNTIALINMLEDYDMSATFFMVGNKLNNSPDSVLRVYNSNSEIGYHSYSHNYLTKQKSNNIKADFNLSNSILFNIVGDSFKLTRPPYGSYNKDVLQSIDTPFVNWNIDTNDWKNRDSEMLIDYVLNNYHNGDIVLCHDTYKSTVDGMKVILKELYLRDVQVVSISKLASLNNASLENHKIYFSIK